MGRLDTQRQSELEPERIASTTRRLRELGYEIETQNPSNIIFKANGLTVIFWPYSGWFSAKKPIGSGRGFKNLLKALENLKETG